MKQVWIAQAKRIDAMSLRERAFMFASIAFALAGLADVMVLSPAFAERRQLSAQMRQQGQQLSALRAQAGASGPGHGDDSPQGRQRAAIELARVEQRAVDEKIRSQFASQEEMARLPAVLDRLLRRHERLSLVRVGLAAPAPAATGAAQGLRWQGVDLSVAGSYADLVHYLTELEQALPGLRWEALQIATPAMSATATAPAAPPKLTVRLMLVEQAT
jgi:MSHA biogenesis protein MshJ